MNVLCIGDVVSKKGCEFLANHLHSLKKLNNIDFTIVNGENSADGNGITPVSAKMIFEAGADVITTGNHAFRRKEVYDFFEENPFILRPANFPKGTTPGKGFGIYDLGKYRVGVINLMGVVYMEPLDCPFETADKIIAEVKKETDIIFVDMHAEATAEKKAIAYYCDGRITALFGTHTHVLTADGDVLPGGTGYISDLGMTGPVNSVIGVKPELAIAKMKTKMPVRFEYSDGEQMINGAVFEIDEKSGKTVSVTNICIR